MHTAWWLVLVLSVANGHVVCHSNVVALVIHVRNLVNKTLLLVLLLVLGRWLLWLIGREISDNSIRVCCHRNALSLGKQDIGQ